MTKKFDVNKTLLIDIIKTLLVILVLSISIISLYGPHFKNKFGEGDNIEWYLEAKERNSFVKIIDFNYYSGRLGPSAYYNPVQLLVWNHLVNNFGQKTYSYYFLIIFMHLASSVMVFFLANKFIKNKFFSCLAALSFGIYYLNYKTAGWIAPGICYSLSAFFALTSFFLFIKYLQTKKLLIYFLSLLFFFFGIFTKEAVVFMAPIITAYYFLIVKEKIFKLKKSDLIVLPYFILSLPIILITFFRLNKSAIINIWGGTNFGVHIFYRFIDFFGYLISTVSVSAGAQLAFAMVVLLFIPLLLYFGFKNKTLLFFIIWLFLSILTYTYSNFREVYSLARYLYLPSIAWFIMIYYIVSNVKNLKLKIIISFFLINYTIILNLLLILIKK